MTTTNDRLERIATDGAGANSPDVDSAALGVAGVLWHRTLRAGPLGYPLSIRDGYADLCGPAATSPRDSVAMFGARLVGHRQPTPPAALATAGIDRREPPNDGAKYPAFAGTAPRSQGGRADLR